MASGFMRRKDVDWATMQILALDSIAQDLVVQENEGVAPVALVASLLPGWNAGAVPEDFAKSRAALNSSGREMTETDLKGLLGRPGASGYFAVSGNLIYAAGASLTFIYSTRVPPMVADSDHNALTDKFSTVILYALLKHAAQRYQDFDALEEHRAAYDQAVATANENYAWTTLATGTESRSPYGGIAANSAR
jgi:hypothetical protein